ncbi:hypothetical protein DEJ47_23945 [Streptomyces venezuelae]|uniref:Uncharacterized protein n=1 Tax=Streptomyces venezuelae TaxID=54571 RepID=A0A5P2BH96_STRVZ|nr:hypothetical protein DEJ47_23945 [Streptomyces venezuelae]
MEWISPVSTLLGAGIGVGATLPADRNRWRRESAESETATRRQLYAEYTAALSRVRTALHEAARTADGPGPGSAEHAREVRARFLAPGAYELRHQLAITAPPEVVAAARSAFIGVTADSEAFERLEAENDATVAELRRVMRRDLGVD